MAAKTPTLSEDGEGSCQETQSTRSLGAEGKEAMITDPLVIKVLDICTCHMSETDNENLENEAQYGIGLGTVYELADYGFLVYVGDLADNWSSDLVSPAFRKVMEVAKELGCDYVRFDRDGREYPELERFEW